jgi:hypothetical protein
MKVDLRVRAKAIEIGIVDGHTDLYYIDIVYPNGNQETVDTGDIEYVTNLIKLITFL